jgi:hypothetical protein
MDTQDITAIVAAVATVTGGIAVGIKWTIKHYLSELKNNGGSSLRDRVDQLFHSQQQQGEEVARLGGRVDTIYQFLLEKHGE